MFLVSGFAASQAGAATTVTFDDVDFSSTADITIAGDTAQFRFAPGTGEVDSLVFSGPVFTALGTSKIGAGAKSFPFGVGVPLSTDEDDYTNTEDYLFEPFDYDLQIAFDVGDRRGYGVANFGFPFNVAARGPSVYGLRSVTYELDAAGAVPELESWALMAAGFGAIGLAARRRRKLALAA